MTWGTWIKHDGRGCPVPSGTVVNIVERSSIGEERSPRTALVHGGNGWFWFDGQRRSTKNPNIWALRIIRYRIRKPKGMEVLTDILRKVEQPAGNPVSTTPAGVVSLASRGAYS